MAWCHFNYQSSEPCFAEAVTLPRCLFLCIWCPLADFYQHKVSDAVSKGLRWRQRKDVVNDTGMSETVRERWILQRWGKSAMTEGFVRYDLLHSWDHVAARLATGSVTHTHTHTHRCRNTRALFSFLYCCPALHTRLKVWQCGGKEFGFPKALDNYKTEAEHLLCRVYTGVNISPGLDLAYKCLDGGPLPV